MILTIFMITVITINIIVFCVCVFWGESLIDFILFVHAFMSL